MSERLSLRLPATPGSLKQLRSAVRRWLRHAGASHAESYEILAAIGEACANAIQHSSAAVGAMFEVEAELNAGIHLRVRSRGSWRAPRPDGDGRGIEIMRRFMDDVQIAETDGAIEVAMFKSIEGGHKVRVPS